MYKQKNKLLKTREDFSHIKAWFLLLELVSDQIRVGTAIELSDVGKEEVT